MPLPLLLVLSPRFFLPGNSQKRLIDRAFVSRAEAAAAAASLGTSDAHYDNRLLYQRT